MRGDRSNLALFNEIATHLTGARNDRMGTGFHFLNRDLGVIPPKRAENLMGKETSKFWKAIFISSVARIIG